MQILSHARVKHGIGLRSCKVRTGQVRNSVKESRPYITYLVVSVIFFAIDDKDTLVLDVSSIGNDDGMQPFDNIGTGFLDVFRSDVLLSLLQLLAEVLTRWRWLGTGGWCPHSSSAPLALSPFNSSPLKVALPNSPYGHRCGIEPFGNLTDVMVRIRESTDPDFHVGIQALGHLM